MRQSPRALLVILLALIGNVVINVGFARASVITEVDIPITGATFNGTSHAFTISGRPASEVMVFYNDGRQPNPVAKDFAIFSLSTIGLAGQITQNGSVITYGSTGTFGNISLLDGNAGFSPLLTASLVSLEMRIINPSLGAFEGSGNFQVTGGSLASEFGVNGGLATIGIAFTVPANFNSSFAALANTSLFPQSVPEPSASLCLGMILFGLFGYGWWSRKNSQV